MFNENFFPTPAAIIQEMIAGLDLEGKTILEPSAGKGDIIDHLLIEGAQVIACEINEDLQKIVKTKCKLLSADFLTVTSDQVSHIDFIIMNPPFSNGAEHILHAYNIAPKGCQIIALSNLSNVKNPFTAARKQLCSIIETEGMYKDLGSCFSDGERSTDVKVAMISIRKPGEGYKSEFEGFFTEEEPEEHQENGIISYNAIRDLVNRYVAAVKLYDKQLDTGKQMHSLLNSFYGESLTFTCTEKGAPVLRNDFKKDLQKAGWKFIFSKMNMDKYSTTGLRNDLNRFVEQQSEIPFTMRNIYKMIDIVVGTQGSRMDQAILEVFNKLTEEYCSENRYNVPGWQTNSHFLVNKTFILPWIVDTDKWSYNKNVIKLNYHRGELINDMVKAMCFLTGTSYDETTPLDHFIDRVKCNYGKWYSWGFFEIKGYKKGTMHFKFNSENLWATFNQRVAKLKGYPLFEGKTQTAYQDRQTGRKS